MIQNFNFYDVYGYLIPGLTLLLTFWLPFGISTKSWPPTQLSSALFAAVLGYVIGHVLQALALNVFPSALKDFRYPSDIFLDKNDPTFSNAFKGRLKDRIGKSFFDIDSLNGEDVPDDSDPAERQKLLGKRRRDAFFLCRNALIQGKAVSYAEQAQGMYALLIGLTVVFGLSGSYYSGWALAGLIPNDNSKLFIWLGVVLTFLIAIVAVARIIISNFDKRILLFKVAFWSVVIGTLPLGYFLGLGRVTDWSQRGVFVIMTLVALLASLICFTAYKYFTQEFAKAVYYAFWIHDKGDTDVGAVNTKTV